MGIKIGTYPNPEEIMGWWGWIEDEAQTWILFIATDGQTWFCNKRDPETGAALDNGTAN